MTMKPWVARMLRRFAGMAALAVGGQFLVWMAMYPRPELPRLPVDRVEVDHPGQRPCVIAHPAAASRLAEFVRGHRREWITSPGDISYPSATFYHGTEFRGWIAWNEHVWVASLNDRYLGVRYTRPEEKQRFRRLLAQGGCPAATLREAI